MLPALDPVNALAFSLYENRGVYALLLGSGVSRPAFIPTGWEITIDLIQRIGALEEAGGQADWDRWYVERFGKRPNYSELLDLLSPSAAERRAILHRYIEPTPSEAEEGRKTPTRAHHAVARLVRDGYIRVIITTNFDRLIESSLRAAGVEPTVIRSDHDLSGAIPLIHSHCYVVKVHGDYLDTRILNTEHELAEYSPAMSQLLDRILDDHGLIVCGWSADWDHALRAAITRAPNRRYPMFWASLSDPSATAKDLIQHRAGRVIMIDGADNFFANLQQKVEIQQELQRPDPRTTAMLVGSAKKYLGKSEFRIELDDLVMNEVRRLKLHMEDPGLGSQGDWSVDLYKARVALYESRCEMPIALFATLGKFGTGSELSLSMAVMQDLATNRVLGGINHWIHLRRYPAVLFLYAYGIGCLKARRLSDLWQWLTYAVPNHHVDKSFPAVSELFLGNWEGCTDELWAKLDTTRRKAPLSEHLHRRMQPSLLDLFLSDEDYSRHFMRFETLASLASLSFSTTKESIREEMKRDGDRNFAFVPLGRAESQFSIRPSIADDLLDPKVQSELANAGFAHGDNEHLALIVKNFRRALTHRGRW